jgi:hypothetical protein
MKKPPLPTTEILKLMIILTIDVVLGPFGLGVLKFNSHHINVLSNVWSTKCRLIACMSAHIMSNLRDESIKPN